MSDERRVETWTYMGRRLAAHGLLAEAWDAPGGRRLFKAEKADPYVVGGRYEVECDDEHRFGKPKYLPHLPHDEKAEAWQLESRAVLAKVAADRLQKKHKEEGRDIGDLTLREVRALASRAPQRDGVFAAVFNYLNQWH